MRRAFTVSILGLFACGAALAATPAMDGIFDGTAVWGPAVATDPVFDDWANTIDAVALHVTADGSYAYFGCQLDESQDWTNWGFAIHCQAGGGNTQEPWIRQIAFDYAEAPDFVLRGNMNNSWRELRTWDGSDWDTGSGVDIGASEAIVSATFVEARLSLAAMGSPQTCAVQFFASGDNNSHGCFDQCPDDETAAEWDPPSPNVLSNAVTVTIGSALAGVARWEMYE